MAAGLNQATSSVMLAAAIAVTTQTKADALLVYADLCQTDSELKAGPGESYKTILVTQKKDPNIQPRGRGRYLVRLPDVNLTRMGLVKMATVVSFSQGVLLADERFVFVTGVAGAQLDTIVVMTVGREFELLQTVGQPVLTEHVRRAVFQRVLNLATSLAAEGREGKAIGGLFVIGDTTEVLKASQQMILNPFHGYAEKQRQILNSDMAETIKEYSALDGAFVIRGNGVVVSAGTYLRPGVAGEDLPQGLGARHAAAAGITASTKSIAITVSQSTGAVRIWRGGKLITEIERAQRQPGSSLPGPKTEM
ncbi:MAG: diadenylate cyclase [Phycisphaerae bacterium]|nr:diadenylate cyclase [Phycisphaerae bacterium]